MGVEKSKWQTMIEADPDHSHRYAQRFRELERAGNDIHGESRFVDAMLARGSSVFDAGCGGGRIAGRLHEAGHRTCGMDLDPVLIEAAREDYRGPVFEVGDLAETPFPGSDFDVIVSAGNVMTFLAPSTRRVVLRRFADALAPHGRVVTAFGAGRGYGFDEFRLDVVAAGLAPQLQLSTWDLRPFEADSTFLISVLGRMA